MIGLNWHIFFASTINIKMNRENKAVAENVTQSENQMIVEYEEYDYDMPLDQYYLSIGLPADWDYEMDDEMLQQIQLDPNWRQELGLISEENN